MNGPGGRASTETHPTLVNAHPWEAQDRPPGGSGQTQLPGEVHRILLVAVSVASCYCKASSVLGLN